MGFFNYFFSPKKTVNQRNIQFGRFSDAYKEEVKYDAWDESLKLFEDHQYIESYKSFFDYITDDSVDNCTVAQVGDILSFDLYQGSKIITGKATAKAFTAECKIAKTEGFHIGFLRNLLEGNYQLKFCRYALDNNDCITMMLSPKSRQ